MAKNRLAILTSGGDAPGMNAAVRAATLVALSRGQTVIGVERGYSGLIDGAFRPLEPGDVAPILRYGGTVLGSTRCAEFRDAEGRDVARRRLAEARIDQVLVIGGNGSLTGADLLGDPADGAEPAPRVIGLPASIDNDIGLTASSIGVDTAANTIVEACDKIADTASAHDRAFIVEVMGRDCGYLAMAASVAAGADHVLFREGGKTGDEHVEDVVQAIVAAANRRSGRRRALIIKSEGVALPVSELKARVDARLKAIGVVARTETRVTVLGHVVRGGSPTAADRLMASRLGHAGVHALLAGETRKMIAWTPARPPEGATRSPVDPRCWQIDLSAVLAETARLLDGTSPTVQWRAKVFENIEGALRL